MKSGNLESSTENRTRGQERSNPDYQKSQTQLCLQIVVLFFTGGEKKERNQNRLYHKTLAKFCHFQSDVSALVFTVFAIESFSHI